jgi:drug/metabolite transporter (DMT)-like permease
VALLWGSAFVPQRVAAEHLGPFLFNGLRFLLGAMVLLPWVGPFLWHGRPACPPEPTRVPAAGTAAPQEAISHFFRCAAIAGILLVAASVCQQAGMKYTTAGNAGFLTGLYVVLVPIVMFVGWRQKIGWQTWAGATIATLGVYLLGVGDRFQIHYGDALEIIGAALWALHVVVVGQAVKHVGVLAFSVGQYFVAGALNLLIGLVLEGNTLPGLAVCWWTVVYVGVVSVAIAYTLQAVGQKHAPAADAAIILSMEAVFAALFGYLLLHEVLTSRQLLGCALILAAMLVVQFKEAASS